MKLLVNRADLMLSRVKSGYSQRELSRLIDASNSYITQIESGDRNPSPRLARKICEVLMVEFESIFFVEGVSKSNHSINV
jgi:putative transcriptional regulator